MKKTTAFILLILLNSCFKKSGTAKLSAGGSGPISANAPIRWSNASLATPLDIRTSEDFVNDFVPADLDGSSHHPIDQMSKKWNAAHDDYTFINIPSTTVVNRAYANASDYNDNEMGIYKHFTWFSNVSSSALAITQFFGFRRNAGTADEYIELTHADIIFNYRDFTFSTDAGSGADYDIHSVAIHEIGHLLGLPHNWDWDSGSVMEPYLGVSDSNRELAVSDNTSIQNNYNLGFALTSRPSKAPQRIESPQEGEAVSGRFHLMKDGTCEHYVDDELIMSH